MTIYVDLLLLLNIGLDFVLLMSVSVVLKRNVKLIRIILGSLIGGFTIISLFLNINSSILLVLKIGFGILMVIVTFGYHDIRYTFNNFYYLIINSIILGGGLYLIKDYGTYNYIVILISTIIIFYLYFKSIRNYRQSYNNYYKVDIYIKNKLYKLNGYLDTGNKLYDQYHHRPVILISERIPHMLEEIIYVPYKSLNNISLLKCLKIDKMVINKKIYNNFLIGLSNDKFNIDGINCILHSNLKGEL